MAASLFHLRTKICSRCRILQATILIKNRNFADDTKKKINLYETLGLKSSATPKEIKKAYYDLTFKYHPDKNEDCVDAATKFREVSEAYEILGNYSLRKKYDKGIPITKVKKMARPVVNHKAQFQEFFDSRSITHAPSDSRSQEVQDLGSYAKEKAKNHDPDRDSFPDSIREKNDNAAVQWIFTIFIIILIILNRR